MNQPSSVSVDVCLTNPFAWPRVKRGSETLIRSLASWLHQTGRRVEIVAGGPTASVYELDGVPVTLVRARSARPIHRDLDEETTIIPALARHLRRTKPSVVHSFLYVDATAARVAGCPYVVSYGGIALRSSGRGHPLKRWLFRRASEGARVILTPSQAAADHLLETYGYRARVIPNGIRVADFAIGPRDRSPFVLCTATPDDVRKRVPVLVDAFAIAHRQCPQLELVLAGSASEARRRALLDRVPDPVRRTIQFVGDLETDQLQELYQRATVTCLPSLNEAFGMVLVESLACGTPVVATESGAIPEIVDDSVGALFAADDVAGCAAALLAVIERSADVSFRLACRSRAERYDWSVIGPQLLDVYAEVGS